MGHGWLDQSRLAKLFAQRRDQRRDSGHPFLASDGSHVRPGSGGFHPDRTRPLATPLSLAAYGGMGRTAIRILAVARFRHFIPRNRRKELVMTTLIVGRFQQLSSADSAVRDLGRVGFRKPEMCLVYVNPHGPHAIPPEGGDMDESPGTHEAGSGAMPGAAGGLGAGTLVGVATLPALGRVGPLLGAAVGAS